MIYLESNGVEYRMRRVTMLPPPPHPPGQGACSIENPCAECAEAYETAYEQRDTVEDATNE